MSTPTRLIRERNELLTDRFHQADSFGAIGWLAAVIEEKQHLRDVLRAIVEQDRLTGPRARTLVLAALGALAIEDIEAAEDALLELLEGGRR